MAKDYKREDILYPDQKIIQSELVHEMQTSYIEYAMSVIVGRALPDVRDGLKPVHRRILYAMYEDNLTSDKPFKKSATCVGDVLGRYHPHGDASVYDAMVRLAQDFSMRYMLVDGHGNFGSVDGDPPAAYRYTEARLSKIANEMLRDIDKDTVDWDPNFDETRREPRVLPCRFPNLLVNGSSGIAVGMATNIPPHNLTEVINACVCVLENPDATLSDLMQHVTGPDFPTRGIIVGRSGIRAAYATGRGRVVVRARTETETWGHDRIRIIVTELPYQVNKRQLIQNISEQVRDKKLDGISGLRDESDRNGMRIVIELKKDANTQVVLNRLFAQTQMQTTFAVNMLALVDNQSQPKILSLRHILDEYLTFQEEIIVRRTKFDLKKALERAHLLEGLLIAEENIDEVIRIIRESYDNAKENLMQRFSLSDVQAQAILDMRLKALQGLEREKLQNEYDELEQRIAYFRELLADPEKVKGVLRDELIAIRDKYGDERKTEIQDIEDDIDIEDLIEEEQCVFTLSHGGNIKRVPVDEYTAQKRGGKGVRAATLRDEDYVETVFTASTHDYILFFTDRGRCYRKKGYLIPEAGRTARGVNTSTSSRWKRTRRSAPCCTCARWTTTRSSSLPRAAARSSAWRSRRCATSARAASARSRLTRATSSSTSCAPMGSRTSSWPRTTGRPSALPRRTCAPWAARPSACAASASRTATGSSARRSRSRMRACCPSPSTATASAPRRPSISAAARSRSTAAARA